MPLERLRDVVLLTSDDDCPGCQVPRELGDDDRRNVDEPPARAWFEAAHGLAWTRDPFDRLIVAHALARRWRLATSDAKILERLDRRQVIEL